MEIEYLTYTAKPSSDGTCYILTDGDRAICRIYFIDNIASFFSHMSPFLSLNDLIAITKITERLHVLL